MKPLRILLVDDRRLFRDSATTLLSTFHGVETVGQVASAAEAFKKLKPTRPQRASTEQLIGKAQHSSRR